MIIYFVVVVVFVNYSNYYNKLININNYLKISYNNSTTTTNTNNVKN